MNRFMQLAAALAVAGHTALFCGCLVRAGEIPLARAAIYLAWFIMAFGLISFSVRF